MDLDPVYLIVGIVITAVAYHRMYGRKPPPEVALLPPPPKVQTMSLSSGYRSVAQIGPSVEVITGLIPRCTVCGSSDVAVIMPLSNYAGDPWSLAECGPCRGRVYAHAS